MMRGDPVMIDSKHLQISSHPPISLRSLRPTRPTSDPPAAPEIRKVAREFESVFLHLLLKSMRATVREGRLMGGGRGGVLFSDLFDQGVARSAGGGLGLAEMLVRRYDARGGRLDLLAR